MDFDEVITNCRKSSIILHSYIFLYFPFDSREKERPRLPFNPILTPLFTSCVSSWANELYLMDCIHCYKGTICHFSPMHAGHVRFLPFYIRINVHGWIQHDIHNFIFIAFTLFWTVKKVCDILFHFFTRLHPLPPWEQPFCTKLFDFSGVMWPRRRPGSRKRIMVQWDESNPEDTFNWLPFQIDSIYCESEIILIKKANSNLTNCASLMFLWKTGFGRYCVWSCTVHWFLLWYMKWMALQL